MTEGWVLGSSRVVQPNDTGGLGTWAENGGGRGKHVKAFRLMAAVGPPDLGTCTPFSDVHRLCLRKAENLCLVCTVSAHA